MIATVVDNLKARWYFNYKHFDHNSNCFVIYLFKYTEAVIMKISGAIFDLDGTLLDSTEMWRGAASRYITSLRKNPEPDLGEKTKAMTLPALCKYLKE